MSRADKAIQWATFKAKPNLFGAGNRAIGHDGIFQHHEYAVPDKKPF
jgi:hypothetical protein